MKQHAKILPLHAKLQANFVPVPLVNEDGLQEQPVPGRQVPQNLSDFDLKLTGDRDVQGVGARRGKRRLTFFVEGLTARG